MPRTTRLARIGGALAVALSAALLVRVASIGELEETTVWVFGLAAVAGGLALLRPGHPAALMGACVIMVVALLPAVLTWVALAYLPAFGLLAWAAILAGLEEARRVRVEGYGADEDGDDLDGEP